VGRPNKDLANEFKERLKWFSIDRYAGLNQLDTLGWFKQLQVRRSLFQRLTEEFPRSLESGDRHPMIWDHSEFFLTIIQETPILNFDREPWLEFEIPRLRTPVHSTTIEEFYLGELAAPESNVAQARRFFDKAGEFRRELGRDGRRLDFWGCAEEVASTITSELRLSGNMEELTIVDWDIENGPSQYFFFDEDMSVGCGEASLDKYLGLKDVGILSIDLNAPESVLVEHFKAVVSRLKTDQQKIRAEKLNSAEWIRCGLLPYIDLELWRLTEALPLHGEAVAPIPDPLIKELILKEDQSEDSKFSSLDHTIRMVTREYFKRMFATPSSLWALLESEAAAQINDVGITPRLERYEVRRRLSRGKEKTKLQKLL
jgi:hypothetical protein